MTLQSIQPPTHQTEWLKLTIDPQQDNAGGVLYSANWITPISPSDFYIDVIAYDHAYKGANWRIYDNIWGFTTQQFNNSHDILVVSDYALGQKFANNGTNGFSGVSNGIPMYYGAESYFTDIDLNVLPNSTDVWFLPPKAIAPANPNDEEVLPFAHFAPLNGLGVASYGMLADNKYDTLAAMYFNVGKTLDPITFQRVIPGYNEGFDFDSPSNGYLLYDNVVDAANDIITDTVDGVSHTILVPKSQEYDIWRTLSRGPIPNATLPAGSKYTNPQAGNILPVTITANNRCVVWVAPYEGDLLTLPQASGTFGSSSVGGSTTDLPKFLKNGGRLFVSGQDIAASLTGRSETNTDTFLTSALESAYKTDNEIQKGNKS